MHKPILRRLALVALPLLLMACDVLTVDQRGVYTSSPTQRISGSVDVPDGDSLTSVDVNGIHATVTDGKWSVDLPLSGNAVFNPALVEARFGSGKVVRERRTVVYGDGTHSQVLPDDTQLSDAVGMRLNDSAFTKLAPAIKAHTPMDPALVAPVGTVVQDGCMSGFGTFCVVYTRSTISVAPTISDYSIAIDSQDQQMQMDVALQDFALTLHVDATVFGAPMPCDLALHVDTVSIPGHYTFGPDPAWFLDVNLVGDPQVNLVGFTRDWIGGLCSIPGVEDFVSSIMGDTETTLHDNLLDSLGDPDGDGPADAPVALATQVALLSLNISGPIGDALGMDLTAKMEAADEDDAGLSVRASGNFRANEVAPGAPDLTHTVGWGDALGPLPLTAPGGQPYDVAVGASASSFNQLLAAETERGLLNLTIDQLGGQPLTLKRLLDLVGAGGSVGQDRPVRLELSPEVAPVITPQAGPGGTFAEMRTAGYRVKVVTTDQPQETLLEVVLDYRHGVVPFWQDGELRLGFTAPAAADFSATVLRNPLGLSDTVWQNAMRAATPAMLDAIRDLLPGFPLPRFVGVRLDYVALSRSGTGVVLFANLAPA
jgi:hypothetical protein